MLKEEKELRNFFKGDPFHYCTKESNKTINNLITALVRAVREDCARVAESDPHWVGRKHIAAAIRGKKG